MVEYDEAELRDIVNDFGTGVADLYEAAKEAARKAGIPVHIICEHLDMAISYSTGE